VTSPNVDDEDDGHDDYVGKRSRELNGPAARRRGGRFTRQSGT
jgi:hypothetical protein